MSQYLLILLAILAVVSGGGAETIASLGASVDHVVAFGIALLLKPWLEYHFD